ncbi:Transmembrane exosortase [Xenococcus sp. PCC 7305]|uniref:archaeosortase/exosortase family protein n=1 Tax=Xenococcus sp. PCC 7305 TaxID=102125 RepID=UPI0002AC76B4|nr:archaeosortase/exosortase family protein [Xenococcus sp. PCC 7305]ELS05527.1 Transmembrane exosortase [Xenococcus sp. PCC 7305]
MEQQIRIRFDDHRFWLLSIAGLLMAFNWYFVEYNLVCLIYWFAALSVTWKRCNDYNFESDIFSTIIGLILIFWLLFRGLIADNHTDVIARMYPLFSVAAILFLSTRASKIFQYWHEILIVSLTGIPWEHIFAILSLTAKISVLDAKIARLLLWYIGFDVYQQDNLVVLPTGSIQIAGACSSFNLLGLMWQSCLVIYLCIALTKNQQFLLWLWATVIALGVNSIRLCLMALLIANDQQAAFDYWHGSSGAEIFTTIAILLLALTYWLLVENKPNFLSNI